jgi:hypothetical protein
LRYGKALTTLIAIMQPERHSPDEGELTRCVWCGAELGQNAMPPQSANVFCSRGCEIDGNFWLYQELLVIEITHPQSAEGACDSP